MVGLGTGHGWPWHSSGQIVVGVAVLHEALEGFRTALGVWREKSAHLVWSRGNEGNMRKSEYGNSARKKRISDIGFLTYRCTINLYFVRKNLFLLMR